MSATSTKQTNAATLEKIAREKLGLDTLETRQSDRLDFHDMAVWSIREALEAAFAAGQQSTTTRKGNR